MSLRAKTLLAFSTAAAALFVSILALSIWMGTSFADQADERLATQHLRRTLSALAHDLKHLSATAADWALWDDTQVYLETGDESFLANVDDQTLRNLDLDLLILLDSDGRIFQVKTIGRAPSAEVPLPEGLDERLTRATERLQDPSSASVQGVLLLEDDLLELVASPVLGSDRQGPSSGTLIMARWLVWEEVLPGGEAEASGIGYSARTGAVGTSEEVGELSAVEDIPVSVGHLSGSENLASAILLDAFGEATLEIDVVEERYMWGVARRAVFTFVAAYLVIALILGAMALAFVDQNVVSRARELERRLDELGSSRDLSTRLSMGGTDEIARIAAEVDELLAALEASQASLKRAYLDVERQVRERTVELEEANEIKSQFLASMSHELRTPMNSILGFTGVLLQELPGSVTDEQRHQLEMIMRSGNRLMALIEDALDLSRIAGGEMRFNITSGDLRDTLHKVSEEMRPAAQVKGLVLVVEDGGPIEIASDFDRVRRVVRNLVDNAIKFTKVGEVRVSATTVGDLAQVVVTDTGIGVLDQYRQSIFDEFWQDKSEATAKTEGAGLGLSVSRRIARLLGGDLVLDPATETPGSSFRLTVPLRPYDE